MSEGGGFELLCLGGAKRLAFSSHKPSSVSLEGSGLLPPAATLIFRWKKARRPRAEGSVAWVRESIVHTPAEPEGPPQGIPLSSDRQKSRV